METEAYLGAQDPACHSYQYRKTKRTQTMFLEGGHSYVYFIYGMYNCFNVVTQKEGEPEAVLIRALEPKEDLNLMKSFRPDKAEKLLTNGPGKLCQALNIDKSLNGLSLAGDQIFIEETQINVLPSQIEESERIGIGYAGDAVSWPLRFFIKDNPFISSP